MDNPSVTKHFIIFCQVIDNFGDIGVCWRLAKQLHHELGQTVSLWVDNLYSLQAICPEVNPALEEQYHLGMTIYRWDGSVSERAHTTIKNSSTVVIEAFGCTLPQPVITAIKQHGCQWLNLEYLALEPWADEVHLASSPVHGCKKIFIVPGFSPRTGGLLIDNALRQLATLPKAQTRENLTARLSHLDLGGLLERYKDDLWISVFSYAAPPFMWLLRALNGGPQILILISDGTTLSALNKALGSNLSPGMHLTVGAAAVVALPFLSQEGYDQVLGACDFNIVRGEESAVRAQLVGKPFLWQLYPQEDNAHHSKLTAFMAQFLKGCPSELAEPLEAIFRIWNGVDNDARTGDLSSLLALQTTAPNSQMQTLWQAHCALWQRTLFRQGSIAKTIFHLNGGCV